MRQKGSENSALRGVRERPVLFSGPMVRAILEGRKTQTRRAIQRRSRWRDDDLGETYHEVVRPGHNWSVDLINRDYPCPYGQPGDRLWVRETWGMSYVDAASDRPHVVGGTWGSPARPDRTPCVVFRADHDEVPDESPHETARWSPSIHMPRWASRLTLEITEVRVESVRDIADSRDDLIAEGIGEQEITAAMAVEYMKLWDELNHSRGYGWDANPWVWAISFRPLKALAAAGEG